MKDFSTLVVSIPTGGAPTSLTDPSIISFAGDPTATGVTAPIGSLGIRTGAPSLYVKTGPNAQDWTIVGTTSGLGSFATFKLTGAVDALSPAISGPVDTYAPAGIGSNVIIRQAVVATGATIKSINASPQQGNGAVLIIENVGPGALRFAHETGPMGVAGANSLLLPGEVDWTLPISGSALLVYDTTATRWRVLVLGTALATAITADSISGAVPDYQPKVAGTDARPNARIRQPLSGDVTLRGLVAQLDGFRTVFENITTTNLITLKHEDPSNPTVANRFALPNLQDFVIPPNGAVSLEYDGTSQRWRVTSASAAAPPTSTTLAGAVRFSGIYSEDINGDRDNYNANGNISSVCILRINPTVQKVMITSMTAQPAGTLMIIQNTSTDASNIKLIGIPHESTAPAALAANKFRLPDLPNSASPWWISPQASYAFVYDGTFQRWVPFAFATNHFPLQGFGGGPGIAVGDPVDKVGVTAITSGGTPTGVLMAGGGQQFVYQGNASGGATETGTATTFKAYTRVEVGQQFRLSGISLASISGTNFGISLQDTTTILQLSASASGSTIATMTTQAGANGRIVSLVNASTFAITILHGNTLNGFLLPNQMNLSLDVNAAATFWYDNGAQRWRVLAS